MLVVREAFDERRRRRRAHDDLGGEGIRHHVRLARQVAAPIDVEDAVDPVAHGLDELQLRLRGHDQTRIVVVAEHRVEDVAGALRLLVEVFVKHAHGVDVAPRRACALLQALLEILAVLA